METVWGYKRLICPKCQPGNKNSKKRGMYTVYETNTHLILQCVKCRNKITVDKKESGQHPSQQKIQIK